MKRIVLIYSLNDKRFCLMCVNLMREYLMGIQYALIIMFYLHAIRGQ